MDVTRLLIALFVGMAVLIFLIMKTRLHPSLSLVISACVVGIVGGVELASIPGLITSGFGNTLAGIGLVIAFGCMMGQIMEESNSAKVMAHTFIKALHGKNEEIALAITGFLVSIPIFADSALILLAPLVKSISQTKKKSPPVWLWLWPVPSTSPTLPYLPRPVLWPSLHSLVTPLIWVPTSCSPLRWASP